MQIAGFGANILLAVAFLGPQCYSASLCEERSDGGMKPLIGIFVLMQFLIVMNYYGNGYDRKAPNHLMKAMH